MRPKDMEDILREMRELRGQAESLEKRLSESSPTSERRETSPARISPTPPPEKNRRGRTDLDRIFAMVVALTIIVGFLIAILIPTVRSDGELAKDLAAIFSGSIAAIVGFYFIQGQAQQAVSYVAGERGLEQGQSAVETMVSALERYKQRTAELEETVNTLGETLLATLDD